MSKTKTKTKALPIKKVVNYDTLCLERNCVVQVKVDFPIRSEFQDLFSPEKGVIN